MGGEFYMAYFQRGVVRKDNESHEEYDEDEQTTIRIDWDVKDALDEVKVIPAEPYNEVIMRLITEYKKHN